MNWDDLKIFLTVAKEGSARSAAEKLSIHHSTVTRRIEAFESSQKTRLFDRFPTGYALTIAGEELLQAVTRVENEINGIERHILGQDIQLQGDIRVTMPDCLAIGLLMPDLVNFMESYPGVNLVVLLSYDLLNLTKREADVAIRVTDNPPEHLVGRKVSHVQCATYASPNYIKQNGLPKCLDSAHWIGWDSPTSNPEWLRKTEFPSLPLRGRLNNVLAQVAAAKAGLGVASLPCFMGDREPELQRIFPGQSRPCHDIWVLTHRDLVSTLRIQTFMDFMAAAFRQKKDQLEGHEG